MIDKSSDVIVAIRIDNSPEPIELIPLEEALLDIGGVVSRSEDLSADSVEFFGLFLELPRFQTILKLQSPCFDEIVVSFEGLLLVEPRI